jgi:DNA processing protein
MTNDLHHARAHLLQVAEPPEPALAALIQKRGPVEAAALVRTGSAPDRVLEATSARRHQNRIDEDSAAALEFRDRRAA